MPPPKTPPQKGFTLIELIIVVAMIAILASISIPKFASLLRKASEGAALGNLGSLRSALHIYYADREGRYPATITGLTVGGKYLTTVPRTKTPNYHADADAEVLLTGSPAPTDAGGWYYNDAPGGSSYGSALVNCTHTDTKGRVWSAY